MPDLLGVFAFAVAGGLSGVRARLDLFGVLVLATVTAVGGGVVRDLLLGLTPPSSLRHWPFLTVAVSAGLLTFWLHARLHLARRAMVMFDAAGLALFTVTGTSLALQSGLEPLGSCAIGLISGIGGGVIRDVLLREVPFVLLREIYAFAALAGSAAICVCHQLHVPEAPAQIGGAALIFLLRMVSIHRNWSAPTAKAITQSDP